MIGSYTFLWSELAGIPVLVIALAYAVNLRRLAQFSGLTFAPFALFGLVYENAYWSPTRLFGVPIGFEDAIFTFRFGALSVLGALWPWRRNLSVGGPTSTSLEFMGLCAGASALAGWLLSHILGVMHTFIVVQCLLAAFLIASRPYLARFLLSGLTVFPGYYVIHIALMSAWLPDFAAMWMGSQPYLATIAGIPVEEFLWVFSASVCFPCMVAVVVNLKFDPSGAASNCLPGSGAPEIRV